MQRQAPSATPTRWVFGYGSLMWRPGFAHGEVRPARIAGFHRALCVHSFVHRGTRERPGLVLGLDRGGSCRGLAFAVDDADWPGVVAYLRGRELVTNVYLEQNVMARLDDGRRVEALTYIVDRTHAQYCADRDAERAARIIEAARGESGPNVDYLLNTLAHLTDLGIRDRLLEAIARQMGAPLTPVARPRPLHP